MFKKFISWLGSLLCAIGLHKWGVSGRWVWTNRIIDGRAVGQTSMKLPVMRQCQRCWLTHYPDFYGAGVDDFSWGEKEDRFPPGIKWVDEGDL